MDLKFNKTMKKIFLTFATAALLSVSASAAIVGDNGAKNTAGISYSVLHEFSDDFADAQDVVWSRTQNTMKADFTENGQKHTAFYSLSGDFLGTTQILDYNVIPAGTKAKIAEKYKGYVAGDVILYQANTAASDYIDPVTYFVVLQNQDHAILVRITDAGNVAFFKRVK